MSYPKGIERLRTLEAKFPITLADLAQAVRDMLSGSASNQLSINTTAPLTGGGTLENDMQLGINPAGEATATVDGSAGSVVYAADGDKSSRKKAATPANVAKQVADAIAQSGQGVPLSRVIDTIAPLTGGRSMAADMQLGIAAATASGATSPGNAGSVTYAAENDRTSKNRAMTPAGFVAAINDMGPSALRPKVPNENIPFWQQVLAEDVGTFKVLPLRVAQVSKRADFCYFKLPDTGIWAYACLNASVMRGALGITQLDNPFYTIGVAAGGTVLTGIFSFLAAASLPTGIAVDDWLVPYWSAANSEWRMGVGRLGKSPINITVDTAAGDIRQWGWTFLGNTVPGSQPQQTENLTPFWSSYDIFSSGYLVWRVA